MECGGVVRVAVAVDEEAAAYLYTGSQMKLVFDTQAKHLVKLFQGLDQK